MKKKIILLVAALMIFATGVSASSLNGEYNGNPIVKLKSNGAVVDTGEVPAMIYDGSTVVPIAALRNLGASVTWDPNTYSVDVSIKNKYSIEDSLKELKSSNISRIELSIGDDGKTYLTYSYNGTDQYLNNHNSDFASILFNSSKSDADMTAFITSDSIYFTVPTNAVKEFYSGKITSETLASYYYKLDLNSFSSAPSNTNQQPITSVPTTTPIISTPVVTTQPDNTCQNLRDKYVLDKSALQRNSNPFSGKSSYAMDMFERETDKTFAQFGCTK